MPELCVCGQKSAVHHQSEHPIFSCKEKHNNVHNSILNQIPFSKHYMNKQWIVQKVSTDWGRGSSAYCILHWTVKIYSNQVPTVKKILTNVTVCLETTKLPLNPFQRSNWLIFVRVCNCTWPRFLSKCPICYLFQRATNNDDITIYMTYNWVRPLPMEIGMITLTFRQPAVRATSTIAFPTGCIVFDSTPAANLRTSISDNLWLPPLHQNVFFVILMTNNIRKNRSWVQGKYTYACSKGKSNHSRVHWVLENTNFENVSSTSPWATTLVTTGLPIVKVPVLSNTNVLTKYNCVN